MPRRVSYRFDRLTLQVWGRSLQLALAFGGVWSECVCLDEQRGVRVMQNSRGDTLVLQRCGGAAAAAVEPG